ncbi:hypothetical protein SGRIM128S_07408 [Streptomyces griseomycini]
MRHSEGWYWPNRALRRRSRGAAAARYVRWPCEVLGALRAQCRPPPRTPARRHRTGPDRLLPRRPGAGRAPRPARPVRHAPTGAQHGGGAVGRRRGGRLRPRAVPPAARGPAAPARRLAPDPQFRLRRHRRTARPPCGPAGRPVATARRLRAHRRPAAGRRLRPLPGRPVAARLPATGGRPPRGRAETRLRRRRDRLRQLRARAGPDPGRTRGTRPRPRPAPGRPAAPRHRPRPLPARPHRPRPAGARVRPAGRPPAGAVRPGGWTPRRGCRC